MIIVCVAGCWELVVGRSFMKWGSGWRWDGGMFGGVQCHHAGFREGQHVRDGYLLLVAGLSRQTQLAEKTV